MMVSDIKLKRYPNTYVDDAIDIGLREKGTVHITSVATPNALKEWKQLTPNNYANLISHESLHDAIDKTYGGRVSYEKATPEHRLSQMGIHPSGNLDRRAIETMKEIGPEGFQKGVLEKAECTNCGDQPNHMHGRHGCCGRQGCHMKLALAHLAYGEQNVTRHMQRNWPSLRGLI